MDPFAGIGTERDGSILQTLRTLSHTAGDELFPILFNCKFDPQFWSELSVNVFDLIINSLIPLNVISESHPL
jgi:hypothetical protein